MHVCIVLQVLPYSKHFVNTQGRYVVKVRVHGYDNPTNKCPVCKDSEDLLPGCCDNSFNVGSCSEEERCDNGFFYCLKDYNSPPDSDPKQPTLCGFHTSDGQISHQNTDGTPIDFAADMVLGIPNPFQLPGITPKWMVCNNYTSTKTQLNNIGQSRTHVAATIHPHVPL